MTPTQIEKIITAFEAELASTADVDTACPPGFAQQHGPWIVAILRETLAKTQTKPKATGRKRARSAYQIWKSDEQVKSAFRLQHPGSDGPTTNKLMGVQWKALTETNRQKWLDAAADEKEQFTAVTTSPPVPKARKRARSAYMFFKTDPQIRSATKSSLPTATIKEISQKFEAAVGRTFTGEEAEVYGNGRTRQTALPRTYPKSRRIGSNPG